ncbi:hypothetical protein FBU59_000193 [Linderina macrospora]|uniref:Uncharacterized protein n=1 Tax=Linderina macrospora TaxID=4868 RepID=A0ACC1JHJ3_9FUNG|nr:hypothetical protein FBU59_000193 [Linderina macrospora]
MDSDSHGSVEVVVEAKERTATPEPAETPAPEDVPKEPDTAQQGALSRGVDTAEHDVPQPDTQEKVPEGLDMVAEMFASDAEDRPDLTAENPSAEHSAISIGDDGVEEAEQPPAPETHAEKHTAPSSDDIPKDSDCAEAKPDDIFIDQESAQNYQHLMAKERRKRRTSRPAKKTARTPPPSRIRLLISDSDDTDGEDPSDILNSQAVLSQRLRPKAENANRFEQAQQRMHEISYDTESDDNGGDSIGEFESQDRVPVDTVDSDSDVGTRRVAKALVIRDTSDEEDAFESEVEVTSAVPPASSDKVNKFLGMFEPRRRKQMQRKQQQLSSRRQALASSSRGVSFGSHNEEIIDDSDDENDPDLADFIVDDDDDDVSAASRLAGHRKLDDRVRSAIAQMPEEFNQLDLPTSFKTYVQYLVHWISNGRKAPVFSDDESRYFYLGYVTVNRALETLEQSLVSSTAWLDGFRHDLSSYPDIAVSRIPGVPGCEACHFRDNRTATFHIVFSGTPYKRGILVPLNRAIFSDSSNGGDSVPIDSDEEMAGRVAEYNVGRMCKSRAQLYHELHHYFYNLSYMIEADLAQLAIGDDRDAEELVVLLEQHRRIDMYYSGFKELLERSKSGLAS